MIDRMVIKMCRNNRCILIICRMLHRCKRVYFPSKRKYNDSTRMLSGRTADSYAALNDSLNLLIPLMLSTFFKIVFNISIRRFICQCRDCSSSESLTGPENNLRVCMCLTLIFSGEIQVDIRLFVAVKSKECFKWNIVTFLNQLFAAIRTLLRRHIASGTSGIFFYLLRIEIHIMAFFTVIMCRQRIYLRDTGHCRHKRRSYRSTRTYQIPIFI